MRQRGRDYKPFALALFLCPQEIITIRRRAARKDKNHNSLTSTLEQLGVRVSDTSALGDGFPDSLLYFCGRWFPAEIKNPNVDSSHQKLTEDEVAWWAKMGSPPIILKTFDDCVRFVNRIRTGG